MGIYIYKETGGTALVYIYAAIKPAKTAVFSTVNGQTPYTNNFTLLDTFDAVAAVEMDGDKDYKTWCDALETCVNDLGGFDSLSGAQQIIAASNKIGTDPQIAATLSDLNTRDSAMLAYGKKMAVDVRPLRAAIVLGIVDSRCLDKDLAGVPMKNKMYQQLNINVALAGELVGNLFNMYVSIGIISLAESEFLGVLDYLNSTDGTRYKDNGFLETFVGITPDGFNSLTDFRDYLVSILQNGQLDTIT